LPKRIGAPAEENDNNTLAANRAQAKLTCDGDSRASVALERHFVRVDLRKKGRETNLLVREQTTLGAITIYERGHGHARRV
jgi:hypothetical protein